ncbi:DUF2877 domain-containing protein [Lacrimispora defluvii]|uniref:DUF2877 domain-containing protein n=1 Tax=Lacrimispora defluvii TaxID=2719233 RepID=A0ABX1VUV4_9FIRM|nr:DUF2877 domain-containing protein [Lacrimispora defluvii]NNJ31549.1 DUF2877 domain-containing protein [Lacrimispora defluvii]
MHFNITTIGSYAMEILNTVSEGRIHSVYRKTINIQLGDYLLALQAASSPISPVSLITELDAASMETLPVSPDLKVKVSQGVLTIYGSVSVINFNFLESDLFESKLISKSHQLTRDTLKSVLDHSNSGGFCNIFASSCVKDQDNNLGAELITRAAKNHLTACNTFMQTADYEKATEELVSLIGLGVGLTPSGDDFLCGVLAGLILTGNSDQTFTSTLKERIGASLNNTNDISRTFLRCALSSHFSKPIKDLVFPATAEDIHAWFEAVGHSSGFDSLCGIYYVYTMIFN